MQIKEDFSRIQIVNRDLHPVFKQPNKASPQQKARADSDIVAIVEISDTIRKGAEKLNKAT